MKKRYKLSELPETLTSLPIGSFGEELACLFLSNVGYKVIERNFRARSGEVDIIAEDGKELVFVEVKTRRETSIDDWDSVNSAKISRIKKSADVFIENNDKVKWEGIRFDVVFIRVGKGFADVFLMKNAFF